MDEIAIDKALETIKSRGFRVIVLYTYFVQASAVLYRASELGMIGKGWVWISTDWLSSETYYLLPKEYRDVVKDAMNGAIGVSPDPGNMETLSKKFLEFKKNHGDIVKEVEDKCKHELSFEEKDIVTSAAYTYDSIYFIGQTLTIMLDKNIDI